MRPTSAISARERRRLSAPLQRANQLRGSRGALSKGTGNPQDVVPVAPNESEADPAPCKTVKHSVVGLPVHPPEPCAPQVGEARAELKPEQAEQPEDEVAVGRGVRHDLTDFETRLVLEQTIENVEGVSNRSGNNDGVEPGELVAGEVVVR